MSTIRKLTYGLNKKYIINTVLSPIVMIGEVLMEVIIPFVMAKIIDVGIAGKDLPFVAKYGGLMIGLAVFSLICGMLGTRFSTVAAQGFAATLRQRLYAKIQGFSFANIDRFSTASLVTRLTTDVNMAQNVYRMLIHMCVRSPFMLIAGTIRAFRMNSQLAVLFLIAVPVIVVSVLVLENLAHPRFLAMLKKFDALNAAIQENLIGIRIVKAYVRGDFE